MKPSRLGIEYLLPIFTNAVGQDDVEHIRATLFNSGNLIEPYHSPNTDVNKRIRYLDPARLAVAEDSPGFPLVALPGAGR